MLNLSWYELQNYQQTSYLHVASAATDTEKKLVPRNVKSDTVLVLGKKGKAQLAINLNTSIRMKAIEGTSLIFWKSIYKELNMK